MDTAGAFTFKLMYLCNAPQPGNIVAETFSNTEVSWVCTRRKFTAETKMFLERITKSFLSLKSKKCFNGKCFVHVNTKTFRT